ncbi:MAG: GAF domain-containing protein [Gammaproteobacteria bacterium]|nr:GAF domain-containing protein [Gammaproteobacteria bacterium]
MFENQALLTQLLSVSRKMAEMRALAPLLSFVIDEVLQLVGANRGYIVLLQADGELDFRIKRDSEKCDIKSREDTISRTVLNETIQTQHSVLVKNAMMDPRFSSAKSVVLLHLRSIMCAPLITQNRIIGAIYVENRTQSGLFSQEDLAPLEFFSNQAAISIENAQLYDGLVVSKNEIVDAYDATLEGWVRALDLRDHETEGHTQRVTIQTIALAKILGIDEHKFIDYRRGALLHDIGKLGIPDNILLKPGPLSKEEWDIMHRHTIYAKDMLEHIRYLSSSLEIPYCHHEKWDGTGYPQGLSGEEIPLAARIFSVIDVWDALTSDRVYRKAWPVEKARKYIVEQTGRHFDPEIAPIFLSSFVDSEK